MMRNIPRIMLAAPASGSGKTTITCGLLQTFLDRGCSLSAFKCGPDYIDPMFHKYVLGVDGGNLDSFFLEEHQVRSQLMEGASGSDMAVIEGVMGYFDGVAGVNTRASSYDIARITDTPVILVVDCKGASLSIAALIQGFLQYKSDDHPSGCIRGVLLNRISGVMAERLKPEIEQLGIPVVGWIPECEEMKLESRHLGLVTPEEMGRLHQQIELLAKQMKKTVDVEKIHAIAKSAPLLTLPGGQIEQRSGRENDTVRIAIARDRAFCFYYQENLRILKELGAELIPFSPMEDQKLPEQVDGIILGGGYPELYAGELSSNKTMLSSVKAMVEIGIPYLAECGGFLYLHRRLEAQDGTIYPMADVIEGDGYRTRRLSRFGYISLIPVQEDQCLETEVKGHEFHYWDSTSCGESWLAKKPSSSRSWNCIHSRAYQIAGFPHLYYPSNPDFISRWLDGCRNYASRRMGDL